MLKKLEDLWGKLNKVFKEVYHLTTCIHFWNIAEHWTFIIGIISSRNSPVLCDVFPRLNLLLWKTDTPALQVPEAILIQTLEKGTEGLAQRRKEEYKLWENSKFRSSSTQA